MKYDIEIRLEKGEGREGLHRELAFAIDCMDVRWTAGTYRIQVERLPAKPKEKPEQPE